MMKTISHLKQQIMDEVNVSKALRKENYELLKKLEFVKSTKSTLSDEMNMLKSATEVGVAIIVYLLH